MLYFIIMKKINEKQIMKKLYEVLDPELNISVVDMGFIYHIDVKKDKVNILMTLTTPGCPLINTIMDDIKEKIKELGFKKNNINIELTFDPPWSMNMVSKKGKALLGI